MLRGRTGTGVVIWGDWKQFHGHPFSAHPNLLEKRTKKMQERKTGSNKETEERAVALVRQERKCFKGKDRCSRCAHSEASSQKPARGPVRGKAADFCNI